MKADAENKTSSINETVTESGTFYIRNERNEDEECFNTYPITVVFEEVLTPTFQQITPICQNESAPNLPNISNENIEGTWSDVISTDELGGTTYTFTPNLGECAEETTMTIQIIDCSEECTPPNFSTENITHCEDENIDLINGVFNNPTGTSVTFHISQNDALEGINPILSNQDTTGVFFVRLFYDNDPNCFSFGNITLTVQEIITPELFIPENYCSNSNPENLVAVPGNGIWSGDGITDSIQGTFDASSVTSDTVTITFTPNGTCVNSSETTIIILPAPTAIIYVGEITVLEGTEVELSTDEHTSYEWSPGTDSSCINCPSTIITPFESETYQLVVTNEYGCRDTTTTYIDVIKECHGAFIPDNFSPNNDGVNDELCVFSNCIVKMRLQIFNRWGERVFISEDENECWNGTFRSEPVNPAIFVYRFEAELSNGQKLKLQGNISVLK
jgi:gliding motility-associated-like protein